MQVNVRQPKLQVTLLKNVGRKAISMGIPVSERFAGQASYVDLTPYIGEQGGVQTAKSVHDPAGTFSLTLTDMYSVEAQDTLYGLVEPMDCIDIRMIAEGQKVAATGGVMPIMMRGFVSEVRRREGMGVDGKPQRSVVISGLDYGCVWQIMNVFMMPNSPKDSASLITSFPFFAQFDVDFTTLPADQFLQQVIDKVINPYLDGMRRQQNGAGTVDPILKFTSDIQVNDAAVMVFGLGGWTGGTIFSLLREYLDVGPWNELFVDDRASGPVIVYRPNPYFASDGTFILPPSGGFALNIGAVELTRSDVVSMTAVRSHQDVANYFFVEAPRIALNTAENLRMSSVYSGTFDSFFIQNYGNVNPNLYGTRRMTERTQQGALSEVNTGNGLPDGPRKTSSDASGIGWIETRRKQLIAQNVDNVVLERGSMRLKGNEAIRAGKYIRLAHGDMKSLYYVESCQHDFVPFGGYTTTIRFCRGTGFIDRVQQSDPYFAELTQERS